MLGGEAEAIGARAGGRLREGSSWRRRSRPAARRSRAPDRTLGRPSSRSRCSTARRTPHLPPHRGDEVAALLAADRPVTDPARAAASLSRRRSSGRPASTAATGAPAAAAAERPVQGVAVAPSRGSGTTLWRRRRRRPASRSPASSSLVGRARTRRRGRVRPSCPGTALSTTPRSCDVDALGRRGGAVSTFGFRSRWHRGEAHGATTPS